MPTPRLARTKDTIKTYVRGVSTLSVAGCITSYMGSVRTIVRGENTGQKGAERLAGVRAPQRVRDKTAGHAAVRAGAEQATVTVLPVAWEAADAGWAGSRGASSEVAGGGPAGRSGRVVAPARRRTARGTATAPRPVPCDRSYAPDLHGSRLTRRGRLAVGLVWAVLLAAMAVMIARPAEPPAPAATTTVVVQPGDTLWSLAGDVLPAADRRVTVDQITELNGIRSAGEIRPGDVLVVPVVPEHADAP